MVLQLRGSSVEAALPPAPPSSKSPSSAAVPAPIPPMGARPQVCAGVDPRRAKVVVVLGFSPTCSSPRQLRQHAQRVAKGRRAHVASRPLRGSSSRPPQVPRASRPPPVSMLRQVPSRPSEGGVLATSGRNGVVEARHRHRHSLARQDRGAHHPGAGDQDPRHGGHPGGARARRVRALWAAARDRCSAARVRPRAPRDWCGPARRGVFALQCSGREAPLIEGPLLCSARGGRTRQ